MAGGVSEEIILAAIGISIFLKFDLKWELTEKWKSFRNDSTGGAYL